jgi:curved DNA-binding protein CbpA
MYKEMNKKTIIGLFELSNNYTMAELKASYKKLIIKYHPDKTQRIADTPMFQMLTECYKTLVNDLQVRTSDKQFGELKKEFEFKKEKEVKAPKKTSQQASGFNPKVFNEMFEQHKLPDARETGYGDWIDNPKSYEEKSKHAVTIYREPKPFLSNADDMACYEFGVSKIKDHSAENNGSLQFSDYRLAHTTDKIIDFDKVKPRKVYKNVSDLEADRGKVSHTMSPREVREHAILAQKKATREANKIEIQKRHDRSIETQSEKINNRLEFIAMR